MKNKVRYIRWIIVIASFITAMMLYLNAYQIELSKLQIGLREYLNDESMKVLKTYDIDHRQKNIIVLYESGDSSGVVLLNKGINKKYLVCYIDKTQGEVSNVSFLINRADYSIIYGSSKSIVSMIRILDGARESYHDVNDNHILIVENSRGYEGTVDVIYENPSIPSKENIEFESNYGSSWRGILVPLRSILLVVVTFLISSLLSKRFNEYLLDEYNNLPKDGQRIKLRRPW